MPKRGRPRFSPTKAQRAVVANLVGFGLDMDRIRLLVMSPETGNPISLATLRRNFKMELVNGAAKANASVLAALHKSAIGGNVTAQIWWTKCRLGWSEYGTTPAEAAIGKKEAADVAARNPDRSTPMGEMMAQRSAQIIKIR